MRRKIMCDCRDRENKITPEMISVAMAFAEPQLGELAPISTASLEVLIGEILEAALYMRGRVTREEAVQDAVLLGRYSQIR